MSETLALEIKNLSKSFKDEESKRHIQAVHPLSLDIKKGELFGLIGPDGAGKTTLFRLLTTLLLPDTGQAKVDGFDIITEYTEIRKHIGYMPGRFSLYQDLSVEENLHFFATLFQTSIADSYEYIRDIYVQIEPFKKRRAGKLSGGMKQKLALCCALIHQPNILFLDEPTTGVDPVSRKEFWEMLRKLQKEGITIMASTPYMDEANRCDRIALMQEGKILSCHSPQDLKTHYPYPLWAVSADNMYPLLLDLRTYPLTYCCYSFGEYHHLSLQKEIEKENLYEYLKSKGYTNIEIHSIQADVEDCFMQLKEAL